MTLPLLPLSPNKSRRYRNLVFFNAITSSRINTSGVSRSLQVRFLIVWFLIASNTSLCICLRLPIPCTCSLPTPHIYNTANRGAFESQSNICGRYFLWKIVSVSPCLLVALIYTKQHDEILDWPHVLISSNTTTRYIRLTRVINSRGVAHKS